MLDRLQAEMQCALEGQTQTTSRAGGTDFAVSKSYHKNLPPTDFYGDMAIKTKHTEHKNPRVYPPDFFHMYRKY